MKILIVSNMFPSKKYPSAGIFVYRFCEILNVIGISYSKSVMQWTTNKYRKVLNYMSFYIKTFVHCVLGRFDKVYIHYASHSSAPVLLAYRIRKFSIITNCHGSDVVPENSKQEKMQKYTKSILAVSDKVVVPSEYFKELVSSKYSIDKNKIIVSPSGGVNKRIFYKEKDRESGNELKIGFVGRISYKKGLDTLLKACSMLSIPYSLMIVGNGPEYQDMKKLVDELGLNEKIEWLDLQPQEELRHIYNNLDAFIFPTERDGESLGLVAIEAMACGTPVIASDHAAPKYYVKDGVNGYKFTMGDENALYDTITKFAGLSDDERRTMSDECLKCAEAYSVENCISIIKDDIFEV